MQYIIVQVSADDNKCHILDICSTRSQAVYRLHNSYCPANDSKVYVKKDKQTFVEEYKLNKGYIYNTKTLKFVYHIVEFTPKDALTKELEVVLQKRKKKN